jgi:hypothetical protein
MEIFIKEREHEVIERLEDAITDKTKSQEIIDKQTSVLDKLREIAQAEEGKEDKDEEEEEDDVDDDDYYL